MDFNRLASEVLRALRGGRSQPAFSRRLKYRSNVAYLWESGRAYPTLATTFAAASASGVDPASALRRFYGPSRVPEWLAEGDIDLRLLASLLLEDLRGGVSLGELSRRTGFTRFAIARWLDGQTAPRLPQALALIEASSLRVLDLVATLVDPKQLPSFAHAHEALVAARRAAYDLPFSQVVLRALELEDYTSLKAHEPGFLAQRLGITAEQEAAELDALKAAGQIRHNGKRYEPTKIQSVDTRGDDVAAATLRRYFAQLAVDRAAQVGPVGSGYNVFSVSRKDYARIVQLQRSYFTQLRAIVADSAPAQVVGLASTHVLLLSDAGGCP